jgi:hypothetical protein
LATGRRDAAQHQPLLAPQPVVAAQQRLGLLDRRACAVARAVEHQSNAAGLALRDVGGELVVDDEHDVEVAAADLGIVIGGRVRHRHLLPLEICDDGRARRLRRRSEAADRVRARPGSRSG